MKKLIKKYKVVAKDGKMLFPLNEDGLQGEVYPGKGAVSFESDDYAEAQKFVEDNNLTYEEDNIEEIV